MSHDDIGKLIALWAVLLGSFLYLYPPWTAGFPINDGGLFYTMIKAIQENGFRLPAYVQYNGLSIPFAYPPLALYAGAVLSTVLQVDLMAILQWLPAITLIATSILLYVLALRFLGSPIAAGIATFLYVCTPRSMTWLVMGGGLTRGFGQLFLLLTVFCVFSLYTLRDHKFVLWSIVAGSLVVLTHPEAALHAVAACLLLWAVKGRDRRATRDSAWVALGVLIVTAVWWVPVLMRYGTAPFVSAGGTGWQLSATLITPLFMTFSEEPMMTVIPVLGLVGLAVSLARRQYVLPAWFVLPFLVDPRSAATVAIVPSVLMAAAALHEVILPAIGRMKAGTSRAQSPGEYDNSSVRLFLAFLGTYMLIMALHAGMELARVRVSPENRSAFEWISHSTPIGSRFLILTGGTEVFCSPVQEWFPVLAGRISETTIQGHEWVSNGHFYERLAGIQQIQLCLNESAPAACVRQRAQALGRDFDYIYVTRIATLTRGCRSGGERHIGDALVNELLADGGYTMIYETEAVDILGAVP